MCTYPFKWDLAACSFITLLLCCKGTWQISTCIPHPAANSNCTVGTCPFVVGGLCFVSLLKICSWTCWGSWPVTASLWRSWSCFSACCEEKEACGWVTAAGSNACSGIQSLDFVSKRLKLPHDAGTVFIFPLQKEVTDSVLNAICTGRDSNHFILCAAETRGQNVVRAESDAPETRPGRLLQLPRPQCSSKISYLSLCRQSWKPRLKVHTVYETPLCLGICSNQHVWRRENIVKQEVVFHLRGSFCVFSLNVVNKVKHLRKSSG